MPTYTDPSTGFSFILPASSTPSLILGDDLVEGRVDAYLAYYVTEQLTNATNLTSYNHPTVFKGTNLSVSGGTVAPLSNTPTIVTTTTANSAIDAKIYIWKTSFTPNADFIGSGSLTLPSNFLGYTYTQITGYVYNGYTGTMTAQSRTITVYASSVTTTFAVDTEITYELTASAPISIEANPGDIDPNQINVDEGATVTFTLQTTHISPGTNLSYRIDGVQLSDFDGISLTGNLTIGVDGRATLSVPIAKDQSTEGLESLTLTILNIQGGDEVSQTIQIIDTSLTPPPSLSLGLRNDSGRFSSDWLTNNSELEIQGLESGAVWEYSLNGGLNWLVGQGNSFRVNGDGNQQVMVRQIDRNGTPSDVTLIGFDLDTIAQRPTMSLLSDSGSLVSDQYTNTGLILIDDLEVDSEWEYSQDGGNLWQLGVGNSLLVNEDGYHQILIRQTDLAGNLSEASQLSFTLDTVVSRVNLGLRNDTGTSSDFITNIGVIDLGDLESGSAWSYSLDGGLNWAVGQGTSLSVNGDGAKQVQIRQTDRAGNLSEVSTLNFTLDTQAHGRPNLNLLSDSGSGAADGITNSGMVVISGLESNSSWEYSLNAGDTWTTGQGNLLQVSGDGAKSIQVRQIDFAGNISEARTLSFTLDTSAITPALSLRNDTGASASDRITNSAIINVSNLEHGSSWEYSLNGGLQWVAGQGNSVSLSGDGLKQLQVRQTDAAGNLSSASSMTLTLDTSAPQIEPILNPQIEGQRTYSLSGFANPQNQVKIVIDELPAVLVVPDNFGEWRLNSLLSPEGFELTGLRQVSISQVDSAGNEGPSKRFFIVAERSPRPDPTYVLTASSDSVDEGSSIVFNLATTNIDPGTDLQYLIEGISSSDIHNGQFYGLVRVGANGQASINVPIKADQQLEGTETLILKVATATASARVNDTSVPTPTPTPTLTINPISKVFDPISESNGLYQLENKQWVIGAANLSVDSSAGSSAIVLKKGAKVFTSSAEKVSLLTYADGTFGVLMAANNSSWSEQKFTSDGQANGAPKKLSKAEMLTYERFFEKDLNEDNRVGEVISESFNLFSSNNLALYKTDANSVVVDVAGLNVGVAVEDPVTLMVGKKAYLPTSTPLALISYEDSTMGIITRSGSNFNEQKFLSSGLASGKAIKLTTTQLLAKESALGVDINGNASIGDSVSFVFDDGLQEGSAFGLYRTESGALIIDGSGLSTGDQTDSPTILMSGSKLFSMKSTAASLLSYDDGFFGLVTGSGTKWTEQLFSADGLASGRAQKLNLLQLLDKELETAEDLDGDQLIGNVITEAMVNGESFQLYKTKTNTFVFDDLGLSQGDTISSEAINLMSSASRSWTVKSGPIVEGLVEIDDQYVELLIQSGTSYTAQKFDLDTGMIYGRALKLNDVALQAREYAYDQDLNNDGSISLIGQISAPADWVL